MQTYIINLKESCQRRENVLRVLAPYKDILEIQFVEAFDGRNLSDNKLEEIFDQKKAYSIYGRKLIGPEVGCTLSHRSCIRAMLHNNVGAALILEDDLAFPKKGVTDELMDLYNFILNNDAPTIVLLSGDYWYTTVKKTESGKTMMAKVREAVCSHAYFINRKAAEIIDRSDLCCLADDWFSIKKLGVEIYAAYPHLADQNRRDLTTEISDSYTGFIRYNLSTGKRIYSYYRAIVKRILLYSGRFECKSFIQ